MQFCVWDNNSVSGSVNIVEKIQDSMFNNFPVTKQCTARKKIMGGREGWVSIIKKIFRRSLRKTGTQFWYRWIFCQRKVGKSNIICVESLCETLVSIGFKNDKLYKFWSTSSQ